MSFGSKCFSPPSSSIQLLLTPQRPTHTVTTPAPLWEISPCAPPSHSAPKMSAQTPLPISASPSGSSTKAKSYSRFGPQCPVLERTWISRSVSLPRAPRPPAKRCKVQILCWSLWALLPCCGEVAFMPLACRGTDPDAVSGVATWIDCCLRPTWGAIVCAIYLHFPNISFVLRATALAHYSVQNQPSLFWNFYSNKGGGS